MKIGICDDEKKVREVLGNKVKQYCPDDAVALYKNGEELLNGKEIPDIIFLDIKMPGLSGMDTAKSLRERSERVILIFITGEDQYVFDAFDVRAFHYLVKPFSDDKFKEVLNQAKKAFWKENDKSHHTVGEKRAMMITSGGKHIRLYFDDIVYAEVYNTKVIVHTLDTEIEYYGNLTALEKTAGQDFVRTHRGYLVHLKYVEKYDASYVYFRKGKALVSKKKYPELVKEMMEYNRRRGFYL